MSFLKKSLPPEDVHFPEPIAEPPPPPQPPPLEVPSPRQEVGLRLSGLGLQFASHISEKQAEELHKRSDKELVANFEAWVLAK